MNRRVLLGTLAAGSAPGVRTARAQSKMMALEAGGRVEWDASSEDVLDNPRAATLSKREYRAPWTHPFHK